MIKDEIQKLISEVEARKKSHREKGDKLDSNIGKSYWLGRETECDFFIIMLKSLLDAETQATVKKPEA